MADFKSIIADLEAGRIRIAERQEDGSYKVNSYIKEAILECFRAGVNIDRSKADFAFFDKDTLPLHTFSAEDKVRIVPGGSSVRCGAYLAPGVIMMPPAYVNIGAYVDEGTLIDSHALVGSCAQIGKRVHLSAAVQIGGVLEPVGALPVIIEDDAFIGGNCGVYEGTVIRRGAVLGTGVIINSSTAVYDAVNGCYIRRNEAGVVEIPENAVVVSGSRPLAKAASEGIQIYTPVIIKYKDSKTSAATALEDALR